MFHLFILLFTFLTPLYAVTSFKDSYPPSTFPFEYFWAPFCSQYEMFFVTLPDRFEFDTTYWTHPLQKGVGCTILCRPSPGYKYYSDDKLLKEIKIDLKLTNSQIINEVNYTINAEATYEDSGWLSTSKEVLTFTQSGILANMRINDAIRPIFTVEDGSVPVGSITFDVTGSVDPFPRRTP